MNWEPELAPGCRLRGDDAHAGLVCMIGAARTLHTVTIDLSGDLITDTEAEIRMAVIRR